MNNEKFSDFSLFLSSPGKLVRKFLWFVTAVYVISGVICAGLYLNAFGFFDSVNSYILAEVLLHSMIRSMTAATMMTLLIDMLGRRSGED